MLHQQSHLTSAQNQPSQHLLMQNHTNENIKEEPSVQQQPNYGSYDPFRSFESSIWEPTVSNGDTWANLNSSNQQTQQSQQHQQQQ